MSQGPQPLVVVNVLIELDKGGIINPEFVEIAIDLLKDDVCNLLVLGVIDSQGLDVEELADLDLVILLFLN